MSPASFARKAASESAHGMLNHKPLAVSLGGGTAVASGSHAAAAPLSPRPTWPCQRLGGGRKTLSPCIVMRL